MSLASSYRCLLLFCFEIDTMAHQAIHPLMSTRAGFTPLHTLVYYAEPGWTRKAAQIIDADPTALDAVDDAGKTPMDFVFGTDDPYELPFEKNERVEFLVIVLRHRPLDQKFWDIIPDFGGPVIGAADVSSAMHAVLCRSSTAELATLVHRMPWVDMCRLQTALMCMNRVFPHAVKDISSLILIDIF